MPKVNFAAVPDPEDYSAIPQGRYLVKIADVKIEQSKHGDEMWRLSQEVCEGRYAGRRVFDRITFSEDGLKRVKLVCSRFGLDVSKELDLQPEMLLGLCAYATVAMGEYQGKKRNEIPFAGYEYAESIDAPAEEEGAGVAETVETNVDDDVPF